MKTLILLCLLSTGDAVECHRLQYPPVTQTVTVEAINPNYDSGIFAPIPSMQDNPTTESVDI